MSQSKSPALFYSLPVLLGVAIFVAMLGFIAFADETEEFHRGSCITKIHKDITWFRIRDVTITKYCKEQP